MQKLKCKKKNLKRLKLKCTETKTLKEKMLIFEWSCHLSAILN